MYRELRANTTTEADGHGVENAPPADSVYEKLPFSGQGNVRWKGVQSLGEDVHADSNSCPNWSVYVYASSRTIPMYPGLKSHRQCLTKDGDWVAVLCSISGEPSEHPLFTVSANGGTISSSSIFPGRPVREVLTELQV